MTITMTITIPDISHNRQFRPFVVYFFWANVLFGRENAKIWPVLTCFITNLRPILAYFLQSLIVPRCTTIDKYQACQWHSKVCSWGVANMSLVRTLGMSKVRKSFRKGWDSILCSQKGKSQLPHKDFCPINLNPKGFEYKSGCAVKWIRRKS